MSLPAQTERQRARDGNEFGNEFSSYLSSPLQLKCFYPAGLICFLHSDLAGNLWGNGVGINPARKPNVSGRRSDSAPLNSAPISTRPATDFLVGISTPEFRPDDATLKYDVTLRQLSLSSCPNPSRAISCSSSLVLLFPLCLDRRSSSLLKFVSRGVGILLGWWRSFNRVGWEYRQPLR